MSSFKEILGRISLTIFGLILLYSYVAAEIWGYTGEHWKDKIESSQVLILGLVTFFISLGTILLIYTKRDKLIAWLSRTNIYIVFGVALLLRIIWAGYSGVSQTSDFIEYKNMAIEILNGENFINFVSSIRPVGSSLFIALHYYLFGINDIFPLISIAILSFLQILFVYKILLQIADESSAKLAAIVLSIFPEHLLLTNLLGTDVIFSTLIYLGLLLLTRAYFSKNRRKFAYLFFTGIVLGSAQWVRATAFIFVLSTIVFVLINNRDSFFRSIKYSTIIGVGFLIVVLPIVDYNFQKTRSFDINPIHGQQGNSLLIGTFIQGQGRQDGWAKKENHTFLKDELEKYLAINHEDEDSLSLHSLNNAKDIVFTKIAQKRVFSNPDGFIKLGLKYKILNLWGNVSGLSWSLDSSFIGKYKSIVWAYSEIWHRLIILLSGLIIFLKGVRKIYQPWDIRQVLVFAAIMTSVVHFVLESQPRYHHMFIPILVMYIAELPSIIQGKQCK